MGAGMVSCFSLWGPLLGPSFYPASSVQASVHDPGHGEWLCLTSSSAPMPELPEVPCRAGLFQRLKSWILFLNLLFISTFLPDLFTGERNVFCTNAGAWYCAWEQEERWSILCFFLPHSIGSFRATTIPTTPSWDLGPVALKGNILYLCGLKPRNSFML